MRPLAESTARVSGKTFERKYIALGRIVKQWHLIMGDEFADKAFPHKIHYRKFKASKKPHTTLEISVSSSDAMLMHYRKDLILQRINSVFGDDWIKDIKFTSAPRGFNVKGFKIPKPVNDVVLDESEETQLLQAIGHVEDKDLEDKLASLGRLVYAESRA